MAGSHGAIRYAGYSSKHRQPCSERILRLCFRNIRKRSTSQKAQSPSLQETQLIFGERNCQACSLWCSGCQLTWKGPEGPLQGLSMFCVWMEIPCTESGQCPHQMTATLKACAFNFLQMLTCPHRIMNIGWILADEARTAVFKGTCFDIQKEGLRRCLSKCLLHKREDLSSNPKHARIKTNSCDSGL